MGLTIKPTQQLLKERNLLRGQRTQIFVDSETVRLMAKYTPLESGTLRNAPYAATKFGSGEIEQATPYARRQYYEEGYQHRGVTTHHWFEAMKANGGAAKILRGAQVIAGAVTT